MRIERRHISERTVTLRAVTGVRTAEGVPAPPAPPPHPGPHCCTTAVTTTITDAGTTTVTTTITATITTTITDAVTGPPHHHLTTGPEVQQPATGGGDRRPVHRVARKNRRRDAPADAVTGCNVGGWHRAGTPAHDAAPPSAAPAANAR